MLFFLVAATFSNQNAAYQNVAMILPVTLLFTGIVCASFGSSLNRKYRKMQKSQIVTSHLDYTRTDT